MGHQPLGDSERCAYAKAMVPELFGWTHGETRLDCPRSQGEEPACRSNQYSDRCHQPPELARRRQDAQHRSAVLSVKPCTAFRLRISSERMFDPSSRFYPFHEPEQSQDARADNAVPHGIPSVMDRIIDRPCLKRLTRFPRDPLRLQGTTHAAQLPVFRIQLKDAP